MKLLGILSPKGGGEAALLSEDEPDISKHMNASFPLPAQGEPPCEVLLRLPVNLILSPRIRNAAGLCSPAILFVLAKMLENRS